jgi:hypothetical protein
MATVCGSDDVGPVASATGPCRTRRCRTAGHPPIALLAPVAAFDATLPLRGEQEDAFQNHHPTHHMW